MLAYEGFNRSGVEERVFPKSRMIFIVGMPRSGTTLVEQILSAHSAVSTAGELGIIYKHMHPRIMQELAIDRSFINEIRVSFLRHMSERNLCSPFIIDKMPSNFLWVGFLMESFRMPGSFTSSVIPEPHAFQYSKTTLPAMAMVMLMILMM